MIDTYVFMYGDSKTGQQQKVSLVTSDAQVKGGVAGVKFSSQGQPLKKDQVNSLMMDALRLQNMSTPDGMGHTIKRDHEGGAWSDKYGGIILEQQYVDAAVRYYNRQHPSSQIPGLKAEYSNGAVVVGAPGPSMGPKP